MKKILSLLLTAALLMTAVCSGISVSALETVEELASSGGEMDLAESGGGVELFVCGDYEYYLSEDGSATVSSYLGSDTEIEVPSQLDGIPVTALSWAFESNETITSVVIPAGVVEIGSGTFRRCSALTSVSIPVTVTTIGWAAFQDCESLSVIDIPDSVYRIGSSAFDGTLWYKNRPDGIIYAGKVAYKMRNSSITSLALPEGTVGIAEDAFSYKNITSVQIPASVRYIAPGAFSGSSGIVSIDVDANNPYYNSANGCNAIIETESGTLIASSKNTVIPDTVHIIASDAFSNSSLESIEIPSSVTQIECNAFFAAGAITSITIPSSVTKIGYDAFAYCRSLVEVNGAEGVRDFESGVFRDTQWWKDQPDGLVYVGNTAYRFKGDGCPAALTLENGTVSIAGDAFSGCETLASVTLPDSLLTIGGSAFSSCSALTEIHFGSNLEKLGDSAFQHCSSLTEITLPDTLKEIGYYVFDTCESLESAVVPGSADEVGWGMFYGCTALKDVTLCEGLKKIPGAMFNDCTALESVTIPSTAETIES